MNSSQKRPIGVFDSGVGGLTVARSLRKCLPGEDVIYFGDTARVPYGNKSKDTVIRFSREITTFLLDRNVKIVVVACNTASSFCIPVLRRTFAVPVTGVIEPGVREAASLTRAGNVGVIGTRSTIKSGSYRKCMADLSPGIKVFGRSCPLFVPLVENRMIEDPVTREMAARYLNPLKEHRIDTLILGCTHYPVLKKIISSEFEGVRLVDSSQAVARAVKEVLKGLDLLSGRRSGGKLKCYVSDDEAGFRKTAGIFLGSPPGVRKVNL